VDCHGTGRTGVLGGHLSFPREGYVTEIRPIPVTWQRGFPVVEVPVAWYCEGEHARQLWRECGGVGVKLDREPEDDRGFMWILNGSGGLQTGERSLIPKPLFDRLPGMVLQDWGDD